MSQPHNHYDVVVVGAGIVGLAHAYHAHRRGLSVAVVEQADEIVGASVQNFGHACVSAQTGEAGRYARRGREHWLRLASAGGFFAAETGTTVVARHDDEMALLTEFAERAADPVTLLDAAQVSNRVPAPGAEVVGGLFMSADLQVDPRTAAPAIASWLAAQGVDFHWRTTATGFAAGCVFTSRGVLRAATTFVAVNADVDRLFPELAENRGLLRCSLHMLKARVPLRGQLSTPLFTGWSLVRYSGFAAMPSAARVRDRLHAQYPDAAAIDLHQMYTPQPDGTLLIGDTHVRAVTASPFADEAGFDLLLEATKELFGVTSIEIQQRWQGVYCSAPDSEFLRSEPIPGTHVVTVTTGIGMTTGLGLAEEVVDAALRVS